MSQPIRMWINQPSTLDRLCRLHGTNVLAVDDTERCMRVYFLSGPVVSQRVLRTALSEGWRSATPVFKETTR